MSAAQSLLLAVVLGVLAVAVVGRTTLGPRSRPRYQGHHTEAALDDQFADDIAEELAPLPPQQHSYVPSPVHYWARQAWLAIGAEPQFPDRLDMLVAGFVPPADLQPEEVMPHAALLQRSGSGRHVSLPGPAQDDRRPQPRHQGNRVQIRAGEPDVAGTGAGRPAVITVPATPGQRAGYWRPNDRELRDVLAPHVYAGLSRTGTEHTVIEASNDREPVGPWTERVTGGDPWDGCGSPEAWVERLFAGLRGAA